MEDRYSKRSPKHRDLSRGQRTDSTFLVGRSIKLLPNHRVWQGKDQLVESSVCLGSLGIEPDSELPGAERERERDGPMSMSIGKDWQATGSPFPHGHRMVVAWCHDAPWLTENASQWLLFRPEIR